MSEKKIMLGNEAIARGAYEAGVKVSAAYPGTPSTEISENIIKYKEEDLTLEDIMCEYLKTDKICRGIYQRFFVYLLHSHRACAVQG